MWSGDELAGMIFITAYHDRISTAVFEHVVWIISIAEVPETAIAQCCEIMNVKLPEFHPPEDLGNHQALAWRRGNDRPTWFSRFAPASEGQRHQHSYYEGEMDEELQFVFRGPEEKLSLSSANLKEFIKTAKGVDDETWLHHLRRHDYSGWFRDIIKDDALAAEIEDIERTQDLSPAKSRGLITNHIHDRFKPQW